MKKKMLLIIAILTLVLPFNVFAINSSYQDVVSEITGTKVEKDKINFYLFRGEGCPHCKQEEQWLVDIKKDYKDYVNFYDFEIWYNADNKEMYDKVREKLGVTQQGVPFTVIGDDYYIGFSDTYSEMMENTIKDYIGKDAKKKIEKNEVTIPILGKINMKHTSIIVISIVLGFIDGFNPCAMWILLFLINMLFRVKNKKKAWILGIIFLFTSGLVYFLSMLGINFVIGALSVKFLKLAISIFILVMGILGMKKYLKIRKEEAGCTIVDDKKRKSLMTKMKKIINSRSFLFSLIGIMALAISVNLIELACSLGFPMIFNEVLTINNVKGISKILYLLVYIFFYMLDDMFVFTVSMATVQATGITNKYNKLCTLISSIIMIAMGLLLIFKPGWLMLNF